MKKRRRQKEFQLVLRERMLRPNGFFSSEYPAKSHSIFSLSQTSDEPTLTRITLDKARLSISSLFRVLGETEVAYQMVLGDIQYNRLPSLKAPSTGVLDEVRDIGAYSDEGLKPATL